MISLIKCNAALSSLTYLPSFKPQFVLSLMPYSSSQLTITMWPVGKIIIVTYRTRQNSRDGKLSWFLRFLLNCKSFPIEYFTRLGIHYYKKLLPRIFIFALTVKLFPLDCFDVNGITCSKVMICIYIRTYMVSWGMVCTHVIRHPQLLLCM